MRLELHINDHHPCSSHPSSLCHCTVAFAAIIQVSSWLSSVRLLFKANIFTNHSMQLHLSFLDMLLECSFIISPHGMLSQHVDADPWTFPPGPWVEEHGQYFNRVRCAAHVSQSCTLTRWMMCMSCARPFNCMQHFQGACAF